MSATLTKQKPFDFNVSRMSSLYNAKTDAGWGESTEESFRVTGVGVAPTGALEEASFFAALDLNLEKHLLLNPKLWWIFSHVGVRHGFALGWSYQTLLGFLGPEKH